jgi:hypothetical protein
VSAACRQGALASPTRPQIPPACCTPLAAAVAAAHRRSQPAEMEGEGVDHITALPNALLESIFRLLDAPTILQRVAPACRRFRAVAESQVCLRWRGSDSDSGSAAAWPSCSPCLPPSLLCCSLCGCSACRQRWPNSCAARPAAAAPPTQAPTRAPPARPSVSPPCGARWCAPTCCATPLSAWTSSWRRGAPPTSIRWPAAGCPGWRWAAATAGAGGCLWASSTRQRERRPCRRPRRRPSSAGSVGRVQRVSQWLAG